MTESVSSQKLTIQEIVSSNTQATQQKAAAEQEVYNQSIFGKVESFTGVDMQNVGSNFNIFESGKSMSTELGELGSGLGQVVTSPLSMAGNLLGGTLKLAGGILSPVLGFAGALLGGGTKTSNTSGNTATGKQSSGTGTTTAGTQTIKVGTTAGTGNTLTINGQTFNLTPVSTGNNGTTTATTDAGTSTGSVSPGGTSASSGTTSSAKTGSSFGSATGISVNNLKSGAASTSDVSNLSRGLEQTNSSVRAAVEELNEANSDVTNAKNAMERLAAAGAKDMSTEGLKSAYVQQQQQQAQADYYGGKVSSMTADLASERDILAELQKDPEKNADRIAQTEKSIARFESQIEDLTVKKNAAEEEVAKLKGKVTDEEKKQYEALGKYKAAQAKYDAAVGVQKTAEANVKTSVNDVLGDSTAEEYAAELGEDGLKTATAQTQSEAKIADKAEKTAKSQKTYDNTLSAQAKEAVLTGKTDTCPDGVDKTAWEHAVKLAQIEKTNTKETASTGPTGSTATISAPLAAEKPEAKAEEKSAAKADESQANDIEAEEAPYEYTEEEIQTAKAELEEYGVENPTTEECMNYIDWDEIPDVDGASEIEAETPTVNQDAAATTSENPVPEGTTPATVSTITPPVTPAGTNETTVVNGQQVRLVDPKKVEVETE